MDSKDFLHLLLGKVNILAGASRLQQNYPNYTELMRVFNVYFTSAYFKSSHKNFLPVPTFTHSVPYSPSHSQQPLNLKVCNTAASSMGEGGSPQAPVSHLWLLLIYPSHEGPGLLCREILPYLLGRDENVLSQGKTGWKSVDVTRFSV
jgi:hypothetical protein